MDAKKFFNKVRSVYGRLNQSQIDGFNAVFLEWQKDGYTDLRHLAYMLATAWHETARTMQAIEEYGKGKGHSYGAIDQKTGYAYYGRGLVQLTFAQNYKKMGAILELPLYERPTLALDPGVAVQIMFEGMLKAKSYHGDFTGLSLEDFFNDKVTDPIGARRIINGTDRAKLIAGYYSTFLEGLH